MKSPYTALVANVLFPMHEQGKRHDSVARMKALEESQWWSAERLRANRDARLRSFLEDIGANVPYYRRIFREAGLDVASAADVESLQRLPFLTKAIVRQCTDDLKSAHARWLKRYNTGGSSGEPLVFFMGRDRISHDVAAKWRATRWWGVDIGDPEIVVWGSPIETSRQDRLRSLRDAILRSTLLPAFEMSEAALDGFVAAIRRRKPRMLFGYPSALSLIAQHATRRGIAMDDLGIRVAFVTSELLYDHQREQIGRVFGCRVANGYGGRDAGFIAHECPAGGMHVSAEDIIVEIVDEEGRVLPEGESGEIVVTHMATGDFPFVRYRTGDRAALDGKPCACGRGLPRLARLEGRATDFVVARDGTVMHGLALIYCVRDLPGVVQFRIEQVDLDRTVVQIVAEPPFGPEQESRIVRDIKARLGADVAVDVQRCDRIPAERSGKHRYVVSRVPAVGNEAADPSNGAMARERH